MWKKTMMAVCLVVIVATAHAQIGYKGQVMFGIFGGINQSGGCVATVHISGYVSAHSIVGLEGIYDQTRCDAGEGDSFQVAQWLGNIHYQYMRRQGDLCCSRPEGYCSEVSVASRKHGMGTWKATATVYGMALEFDVEYVLGQHWTLALQPRMAYLINTKFDSVKVTAEIRP